MCWNEWKRCKVVMRKERKGVGEEGKQDMRVESGAGKEKKKKGRGWES